MFRLKEKLSQCTCVGAKCYGPSKQVNVKNCLCFNINLFPEGEPLGRLTCRELAPSPGYRDSPSKGMRQECLTGWRVPCTFKAALRESILSQP